LQINGKTICHLNWLFSNEILNKESLLLSNCLAQIISLARDNNAFKFAFEQPKPIPLFFKKKQFQMEFKIPDPCGLATVQPK
jgi:hypothetical protein